MSVVTGFPVPVQLSEAADTQRAEVVIRDYSFSPRSVNVSTGMTVVWNYSGPGSDLHTVTSENQTGGGSPVFASPNLAPGYTYSLVFSKPGIYRYFCAFHPTLMKDAWVNVTGPPLSDDGAPWYDGLVLVAGGIVAVPLIAVLVVFLFRRRRKGLPGVGLRMFILAPGKMDPAGRRTGSSWEGGRYGLLDLLCLLDGGLHANGY